MFYADARLLKPPVFKRLTGVPPDTFQAMRAALAEHLPTGGRRARHCRARHCRARHCRARHCREDRLLMTLMYWREYRTYAHIAHTYGLSESAVCRTVHAVENALLRSGAFTLPGRKALTRSDIQFEVVVVDATECPVERPKKSRDAPTAARRSGTLRKRRSSRTRGPGAS